MNVLFLTLLDFKTIDEHNIYTDLLREFAKNGHKLYVISPVERRKNQKTELLSTNKATILKLKIGNIQKTSIIEKGISTVTLEGKFISAIKKYFSDVKFDLVLYSTPPITLQKAIQFVKKRDKAISYLLLKDIFPQNAVDLGMLSKHGMKGILYKYFRKKEKILYANSDYIGCMSQANVDYVINHNPEVNPEIVEICPNCIEPMSISKSNIAEADALKAKYHIPQNKILLLFGGNLGKPQGLDFLLRVIEQYQGTDFFFLIVGDGTEYSKINQCITKKYRDRAMVIKYLPKETYDLIVNICDVGLIFLTSQFTVPNIPSRILSYMEAALPMLAATDTNTDLLQIIEKGEMGYWCLNGDLEAFFDNMTKLLSTNERERVGLNARKYLEEHYTARHSYEVIEKHFTEKQKNGEKANINH